MKKPTLNDRWLWILETVHIPLWLVKDLCWLLTWKTLGVIMAIPTVLVAIIITVVSYQDKIFTQYIHCLLDNSQCQLDGSRIF